MSGLRGQRIPLAPRALHIMLLPALRTDGVGDLVVFPGALAVVVRKNLLVRVRHDAPGKTVDTPPPPPPPWLPTIGLAGWCFRWATMRALLDGVVRYLLVGRV